ncbi:class D sortase [Sporosarcina sp. FA9]|uniref:class D sortase n=1 Tax=Sporosarcina sp. FA9 TaxID=3413030 RepID=UPI003F65A556
MHRKRSFINKYKGTHMLSLGFLVLGISCIIWALFQIYSHSVPVSAPAILKKEQYETIALPTVTEDIITNEILYPIRPTIGENIGNLTIPAINQVIPIFHGTDEDELKKGIGHFSGSVLPGESDNSVLSGHRDTVFRELGQLQIKDQLIVNTSAGIFTYEIKDIKIVGSDDKTIITPTNHSVLTVTTCYPFDYIGYAPDRYILIADLVARE